MAIIRTKRHYHDQWTAIVIENYDGPDSANGWGHTEVEAILDLAEQVVERNARDAQIRASWSTSNAV